MKRVSTGVSYWIAITIALGVAPAAQEQTSAAFEVASVKLSTSTDGAGILKPTLGMLTVRNGSLLSCITWAFNLKGYEVVGPDWLKQQSGAPRYDIDAKAAGPAPFDAMRPMLRTLLQERFHLRTHSETRETDVYALTLAKGGPKHLETAAGDARCGMQIAGVPGKGQHVTFQGCTAENLAGFLPAWGLEGPVVDMTGLKGKYNFTFDVPPDDPAIENRAEQSLQVIFPAVEQQFGIRVQKRKAPISVLVVDSADQAPTAN
jgi:uncharacterized protein (TIGR03435 family)